MSRRDLLAGSTVVAAVGAVWSRLRDAVGESTLADRLRESPLARRVPGSADRTERVLAAVRGSVAGWFLRAPPPSFVTVASDDSVAFRVATRLSTPAERVLAAAGQAWASTVAPYPLRAVGLLVGPVVALRLAQEVGAPDSTAAGTALWTVLLTLALAGSLLPLDWATVRRTRTGRALAAVLSLPPE